MGRIGEISQSAYIPSHPIKILGIPQEYRCAGQDRRSLTSVPLDSSASSRATSSRSVFLFISWFPQQISGFKKKCLPSRVLRRQTHDNAVPYPI